MKIMTAGNNAAATTMTTTRAYNATNDFLLGWLMFLRRCILFPLHLQLWRQPWMNGEFWKFPQLAPFIMRRYPIAAASAPWWFQHG
jgi:hypothetical protein